jgi:hypothetical protein
LVGEAIWVPGEDDGYAWQMLGWGCAYYRGFAWTGDGFWVSSYISYIEDTVGFFGLRFGKWYGWHAARRGLGSNLYRMGVPDMVIQRILRHANVSTTAMYYIKTAADDVRNAMSKLESHIAKSEHARPESAETEVHKLSVVQ